MTPRILMTGAGDFVGSVLALLRKVTGWQSNSPIEQTLGELLNFWPRQVESE